jgi:NADH-quinone oxidoreductase subunit J
MFGSGAYHQLLFWTFAVLAVAPGLGILISKDIVRQAFWLLASLSGFAGLYLHLGADFLGFTQVVVYIGGILILFLFGVMLTQRADVPLKEVRGWGLILPGLIAGALSAAGLLAVILKTPEWREARQPGPTSTTATAEIGKEVLSSYLLPFEVISVVLLVAMVGATYIARRREEGGSER